MSIQSEITLLQNTKDGLRTAIMEKGVTVYDSDLFSTYPTRISQISMTAGDKDSLFRSILERNVTELEIPDGVKYIAPYRFYGITTLTSLTIPATVDTIGYFAFNGCSSLESITINAVNPPYLSIFGDGQTTYLPFDDTNNCPIIVPVASVDAYKAANNWSAYADRIVGEGVAYWKLTDSWCDTDRSGKNTGYIFKLYEDVNPSSSTYGNTRTDYAEDEVTCPIPVYAGFRRITNINDVTSGKYLIVDTANNIALNASLIAETSSTSDGINANSNYISVDIDTADDTIEATETTLNAAVDYDGTYLTWTDENSGTVYHLTQNGTNTIVFKPVATSSIHEITPFDSSNGGFTFQSPTKAIALFTNTSNNSKFRWQDKTKPSNFINVALFKLTE